MIAVNRTKYGIPIKEIFFALDLSIIDRNATIIFFVQAGERAEGMRPFKTAIVDLSRDEDMIFGDLSSNTRYKIRRAEREGFVVRVDLKPDQEKIASFAGYFDDFAMQKKFPLCNRKKLSALDGERALSLTSVEAPDGNVLAAHAWVCDRSLKRVRLLYSASHFRSLSESTDRNAIGRANRLLHWQEMAEFKRAGYLHYDLGGLPIDDSDPERNSIARFKREFGGREVIEYTGIIAGNRIGRILAALNGIKGKCKYDNKPLPVSP